MTLSESEVESARGRTRREQDERGLLLEFCRWWVNYIYENTDCGEGCAPNEEEVEQFLAQRK